MQHPFLRLPTPCVLGHRGAAGECPENTLTSFERALTRGAAIVETDARLTRDGVAVLVHDAEVDRTTDGSGAVSAHPLAALRRLDAGFHWSPPRGRTAGHPYRGRGVRIPTLEETLATFPEARFNVELKDRDPRLADAALAAVAAADAGDRVLLTTGDDETMAGLRARAEAGAAGVAIGACTGEIAAFLKSALAGAEPPGWLSVLQVPAFFAGRALVTAPFVAHAHAHDIAVHVWTINDVDEMDRLLELGVDGLVTDFPGRAVERIEARG